MWEARTGAGFHCTGEADRVEDHGSERGWGERRARSERAGKTGGEHDSGRSFERWERERRRSCEMDVRVAEEAEVGQENADRMPPCGDELGGEVTREVC